MAIPRAPSGTRAECKGFHPLDAAVIDIGLPDRRGDALFREIRALYSSLPIVLATGQNVADLRAIFHGEQRVAFVSKPYTDSELLAALQSLGLLSA